MHAKRQKNNEKGTAYTVPLLYWLGGHPTVYAPSASTVMEAAKNFVSAAIR